MNEERIKEVFSDEEFVKELFSKETPEEAQALLEEKDIDFSVEDIIKLREILLAKIEQQASGEEGELGEEDLEEVSGGVLPLFAVAAALAPLLILGGISGAVGIAESVIRRRW
ncbi:MAG: class IIb bacteriocin, lactobin A/cerein 7B family [Oscillospiraceae bacterium]|nr:class IIb bacteriocin, lactobin A/cerein 7B family [Oscillospiraceae bacterium]